MNEEKARTGIRVREVEKAYSIRVYSQGRGEKEERLLYPNKRFSMVRDNGLARKRLVAQRRRCEGVYNRADEASGIACGKEPRRSG